MDALLTRALVLVGVGSVSTETLYEVKLLAFFAALLSALILGNVLAWRAVGDTISEVYAHPERFTIDGDAALISHVTVGVEYKVASAQAAADAEADAFTDGCVGASPGSSSSSRTPHGGGGTLLPPTHDGPRVGASSRVSGRPVASSRRSSPPPSTLGRDKYFAQSAAASVQERARAQGRVKDAASEEAAPAPAPASPATGGLTPSQPAARLRYPSEDGGSSSWQSPRGGLFAGDGTPTPMSPLTAGTGRGAYSTEEEVVEEEGEEPEGPLIDDAEEAQDGSVWVEHVSSSVKGRGGRPPPAPLLSPSGLPPHADGAASAAQSHTDAEVTGTPDSSVPQPGQAGEPAGTGAGAVRHRRQG